MSSGVKQLAPSAKDIMVLGKRCSFGGIGDVMPCVLETGAWMQAAAPAVLVVCMEIVVVGKIADSTCELFKLNKSKNKHRMK